MALVGKPYLSKENKTSEAFRKDWGAAVGALSESDVKMAMNAQYNNSAADFNREAVQNLRVSTPLSTAMAERDG